MLNFLNFLAENFDLPILEWIAANLKCEFLDVVMPLITKFGDGGIFWILMAVILACIPKYRKTGFKMGTSLFIGFMAVNLLLKPLIARPRPYDYELEYFGNVINLLVRAPRDFSFPSGHTLVSFEAATVLLLNDRRLGIPAAVLAVLVAFSRLYLYVHYPTDVLCAAVVGIVFGFVGSFAVEKVSPISDLPKSHGAGSGDIQ